MGNYPLLLYGRLVRGLLHTCCFQHTKDILTDRLSYFTTFLDNINPVVGLRRQNDENVGNRLILNMRVCLVGIFSTAFALVAPTSSIVTAVKTLQDFSTPHSYGWHRKPGGVIHAGNKGHTGPGESSPREEKLIRCHSNACHSLTCVRYIPGFL